MAFNLGFPLVAGGTVLPVWISTSTAADGGPGCAYWNREPLNLTQPFGADFEDLNSTITRIVARRNIYFRCTGLRSDAKGRVTIHGRSYGLAMRLMEHFDVDEVSPKSSADDVYILLTGRIGTDGRPLPLGDAVSLKLKGQYTRNNSCSLLLLDEDYEMLDESSGRFFPASVSLAKLPASLSDLNQWLLSESMGRAYILPITSAGLWQPSGQPWWKGLGKFLDLTEADRLSRPLQAAAVAAGTSRTIEPAAPVAPQPESIGALYSAALPSHPEYLSSFLQRHGELCGRTLFPNGVAAQALQRRSDLFFDAAAGVMPDRHILIGGPTGCGKTFLTEALLLNEVLEMDSHAIYIGPTRSLAVERWEELRRHLLLEDRDEFRDDGDILISTGEISTNDWRLHRNRYRIAVLVNEKANLFLRPSTDFLRRLGLIVVDELHMLAEPNRGGVLDMLLAKVHRENIRRLDQGERPLRVIGITTESAVQEKSVQIAFSTPIGAAVDDRLGPVLLSSDVRPREVDHVACVYRSRGDENPTEIPITRFRTQQDRLLSPERCTEISRKIVGEINKLERDATPSRSHARTETLSTILGEVVLRYCRNNYRTILVAVPSIPGLTDLARQVKNKRKSAGYEGVQHAELLEQVQQGAVGRSVGETLLELSQYGVYVHHSELPRRIREVVEKHFRSPHTRDDGLPEILFATETLFYGVNLTVECLILASPLWTREIPGEGELEQVALSANEFHNILGRVGRPGFDEGQMPKAVESGPQSQDHFSAAIS